MNSLVTIIVPIYNKEKKLHKNLESLLRQTYSNIEIILINDGSSDKSLDISVSFAKKDQRIKVVNQKNQGVSVARNKGIERANGDYIMFIDPDDWVEDNIVERLLQISKKTHADISMCCAVVEYDNETHINSFFKNYNGNILKERAVAQLFSNTYYEDSDNFMDIGVPWGKLYKSDYIKKNNILFKPSLRRMQDNIFNLYAFQYATEIFYVDEPLYHYNFEHFKTGSRKFVSDAVVLYTNLADEFIKFYNKFYLDDSILYSLLQKRLSGLLVTILTNNVYNPKNNSDNNQRVSIVKRLVEKSSFVKIFTNNNFSGYPLKLKIILFLLKNKKYKEVLILYKIGFKLKL